MATIKNIYSLTATTNSNGDITGEDVTEGAHYDVIGVLVTLDDGTASPVIVRPTKTGAYTYSFRVFKRNSDGTISALADTQVRFTIAACG